MVNRLMKRCALILGGGVFQLDLIRRVQTLGYRAVVTDISADAAGSTVADEFVAVDTNDRVALLDVARQHRVQLVLGDQADRVVPIQGWLNSRLGLPGIDEATAERFTNKLAMRDALARTGVAMPRYAVASSLAAARKLAASMGYPVVLKPKLSWASMGVFKVDSPDELAQHYPETLRHAADGRILVEEFVDGLEITVEGYCHGGRFYLLAVSEKAHFAHQVCVARRLAYPPRLPANVLERIERDAARVVEGLGLREGISHAEYRLRDEIPYLIEVAARGGGNRISSLIVPHVSGVDCYELLVRRLEGQTLPMPPRRARAAALEFFNFQPGLVRRIDGLAQVHAEGLVAQLELKFQAGDRIAVPTDDRARVGFFIALGETRDEVDAKSQRVRELVQVHYDEMPASQAA
jgi:biotin carboxylase